MAAATVPEYKTLIPAFNEDADLHAVGRAPLPGPTAALPGFKHLFDHQRAQVRDRMAHAALFRRRGHDVHVPQPFQLALHGRQARGVNPVVVRQQNQHA
jgi:hypothetical protein